MEINLFLSLQFLPVPELMPFRLTRQIVNLMQPLKESGLIQSVMVHSLRAYRAEPDLLLNTMDVFVKEPSLDWKVKTDLLNYRCLTSKLFSSVYCVL